MFHPVFLRNLQLTDLNPRICGIHNCEPGEIYPWHHIERHVLHYVTEGSGRYLVNGQTHPVRAGDIFISHTGYHTSYEADAKDPFTYIWVSFECSNSFAELMPDDVIYAPWAASIFCRITECESLSAPEWMICAQLYEFFAQLSDRSQPHPVRKEDYVNRAINYIQSDYAEPIQIADMAAALNLSRNYFSRIFHQQTGQSPQEYLVSYRLKKAVELISQYGLSQKEAAAQVGYPDVAAFSRMFRRKYGTSPGIYIRSLHTRTEIK